MEWKDDSPRVVRKPHLGWERILRNWMLAGGTFMPMHWQTSTKKPRCACCGATLSGRDAIFDGYPAACRHHEELVYEQKRLSLDC